MFFTLFLSLFQDPLQPLTVTVPQISTDKAFVTSPSSDDTTASAEAYARDENVEVSEDLRMHTQQGLLCRICSLL